jgi:hypothetical protein
MICVQQKYAKTVLTVNNCGIGGGVSDKCWCCALHCVFWRVKKNDFLNLDPEIRDLLVEKILRSGWPI